MPIGRSNTDVVHLAQRLMRDDSSHPEGIRACAEFIGAWLDARDVPFDTFTVHENLPVIAAEVGEGERTLILHAHLDVVPASAAQFEPYIDDEGRLCGRGAYDMKGALAAMMAVVADLAATPDDERPPMRVRLLIVPDEESDEERAEWGTPALIEREYLGDFVVCGEPTDFHVGIQAKGVLDVRIDVSGESAHGATPWLGVNAIERAMDVWDQLVRLPFAQESSAMFQRPSINLGRIHGGGRLNLVPDHCSIEVDIRFLPEQPVDRIREELRSLPGCTVRELSHRPPADVSPTDPWAVALRDAARHCVAPTDDDIVFVGRDGTNDGVHFLVRGIQSVEFGPVGAGHHSEHEWVGVASLETYRATLCRFITAMAQPTSLL